MAQINYKDNYPVAIKQIKGYLPVFSGKRLDRIASILWTAKSQEIELEERPEFIELRIKVDDATRIGANWWIEWGTVGAYICNGIGLNKYSLLLHKKQIAWE